MKEFLIILGHGGSDPGASGSGTNERDFLRQQLRPHLWKWAEKSKHMIYFYDDNAYQTRHMDRVKTDVSVVELHLDSALSVGHGGHVIIKAGFTPNAIDNRLAEMIKRNFGCRGNRCIDGRHNLQNLEIAAHRGIDYRLIEYCFINNQKHMDYFKANLDKVAKETIEALTGEALADPKPQPKPEAKPQPKPTPGGGEDEWTTKVKADMIDHKIMSDSAWDEPITKMQLASILYTAKRLKYMEEK